MNRFETELDLMGEPRPARVMWDSVWGDILIDRVLIAMVVNETYTSLGVYDPHPLTRWLDVTPILSDTQALALTKAIKAAAEQARAEDYDDGRMLAWEEKNRRLLAA